MNTTYDEIWECFLENSKTDNTNLPSTDSGKYAMIKNAVRHYNNRMETTVTCDNLTEKISVAMDDNSLIILAHFLKLKFLENDLTDYVTIWGSFTKEVGLNNYSKTLEGKQYLVKKEEDVIDELILNTVTDWEV